VAYRVMTLAHVTGVRKAKRVASAGRLQAPERYDSSGSLQLTTRSLKIISTRRYSSNAALSIRITPGAASKASGDGVGPSTCSAVAFAHSALAMQYRR
jgi:hypothetical protein